MSERTWTIRNVESKPIDRVAARVVRGGNNEHCQHTTSAEYGKEPPRLFHWHGPRDMDLTGERNGRVEIVGYGGSRNGRGSLWVGRCDCGMYVRRRSSTWRKTDAPDTGCERCRKNEYRKRRASEIDAGDIPSYI